MSGLLNADPTFLFSKDPKSLQVYKVDSFLDDYTIVDNVTNKLGVNNFVLPIATVVIQYEDAQDVDQQGGAEGDPSYKLRTYSNPTASPTCSPAPPPGCPTPKSAPPPPGTPPPPPPAVRSQSEFNGDIDRVDINLNITTTDAGQAAIAQQIMTKLKQRIDLLGQIISGKRGSTYNFATNFGDTGTHEEFAEYMMEINRTIGSFFFETVYDKVSTTQQTRPISGLDPKQRRAQEDADRIRLTAIANLKSLLVPWRFEPLMQALRRASVRSMEWAMDKDARFNPDTFISGFSNRAAMSAPLTKKHYYKLRSLMYDYFIMDKTITQEDDRNILLFMKKLLVDIYIKTCYPLLHYDLLNMLMIRYVRQGNFINARFALVAKCVLTCVLVMRVNTLANNATVTPTADSITNNIITYIRRNNNGDITSTDSADQQMNNILRNLHKLSNSVAKDSNDMVLLQKAIADNQLTMRTVSAAIENRKKDIEAKVIEFWIVFSILIITIVACAVLYFFDLADIGLMVAAGVLGITLIFQLVMLIAAFVKNN